MREGTPSRTAAWVALARGLGERLPREAQLAIDPYGAAFEEGSRPALQRMIERTGLRVERFLPIKAWILYMQVRTRVIDDALRAFVARGGRQLVLLGAGYDTRALRLPELAGVRVFEIDHPATQGHKREVLDRIGAQSPSTYLAWHFEERPMTELPGALAEIGHDPKALSFTIWEGVTMYLTEGAIDASLRAIRAWSAPGSELAMTYFARTRIDRPSLATRVISTVVARVGEPWKWGWDPAELPRYLADRGFSVARDLAMSEAARELLPAPFASLVSRDDQRISFSRSHESIAIATSP
jgi:methyltransferase (TIGR00027 family)